MIVLKQLTNKIKTFNLCLQLFDIAYILQTTRYNLWLLLLISLHFSSFNRGIKDLVTVITLISNILVMVELFI